MPELPPVGTRLHALGRKGRRAEAVIVIDESLPGGRAVETGGSHYRTLSGAATALCGSRRNGWRRWRTEDGRPVGETRTEVRRSG